ncbi:hypothetical protein K443DRAFT_113859 [Laccaria amethystina LaAM-08-1]|uniref:Uncharacterized protein n=1 Tax=Laccaria amethystina LaAM-08-1 TaxID=1095629 RepID=A0A0C9WNT3_9AGAR|nr:hypothetical protein K443DRAFT_113859 [Laccaria amethystina LaAM-08-1]
MDQLASLAGVFAVALLRLLYVQFHHHRHQNSSYDKRPTPQQDEESQPLIAPPDVAQVFLRPGGKLTCILAAIAYIAMTIFGRAMWFSTLTVDYEVTIVTVKEYGGPVLIDSRFVFGRGGMITVALIVLTRTLFYHSPDLLLKLRADAVALVVIPYVMEIFGAPVAQFTERRLMDFSIAPALGAACFLAAKE